MVWADSKYTLINYKIVFYQQIPLLFSNGWWRFYEIPRGVNAQARLKLSFIFGMVSKLSQKTSKKSWGVHHVALLAAQTQASSKTWGITCEVVTWQLEWLGDLLIVADIRNNANMVLFIALQITWIIFILQTQSFEVLYTFKYLIVERDSIWESALSLARLSKSHHDLNIVNLA